ncbi:serine/threonine protein kinase [Nostocaceae cyanobacterium CENA357]|uniref:non-specific serine/threonine protein kinase n=1 Tax=Atlanticothrix silvestris CENA357 TaxID=1725252 RepID=A0A8J7L4Y0_9CYAN|nr:serine/threonine-protein kinase [Atlanticothrix silvestris]MBH8555474.1 serine/threonine protein kinase [Atlanticothrix silvestris CENA357]
MLSSKLLGERYQVVQVLGQGAFCQTYMVQDTDLPSHPTRVVKHFLPSSRYCIPVEIRRRLFTREVEALKKLTNYDLVPHVLASFEDNLEFYLVQEFIEGHPLSVELSPGYCWSERKVFQLLQEILGILNFVHAQGLIHRDVKPNNIIRRKQDNRLILIDFGAVKPIWDELVRGQGETSIFLPIEQHTTIAIGTPGYMPNEQQRGKPRPNSDIYALGMIGIQALTGVHPTQLPEDANTGEIIWQDRAQVSAELAAVLNKMVRYHFQDRYHSAKEASEALLPLTNLYPPVQELDPNDPTILWSQLLSPGQDTNEILGSKTSAPLLDNQNSDITLPEESLPPNNLYPPKQELSSNSPAVSVMTVPQTPLLKHDTNKVFKEKASSLAVQQTNNTTITIFPRKSALLIGLMVGAVSGLFLMVLSYWSMQVISPTPKVESWQIQLFKKSR